MTVNTEELIVNGMVFVPKDSIKNTPKISTNGLECVMVRTYSAGVFYGYLAKKDGKEVELLNAKRVWYWSGASSLSQLAMEGTSKPKECKIPIAVTKIILTEAIEIIPLTEKAFGSLEKVPLWNS